MNLVVQCGPGFLERWVELPADILQWANGCLVFEDLAWMPAETAMLAWPAGTTGPNGEKVTLFTCRSPELAEILALSEHTLTQAALAAAERPE